MVLRPLLLGPVFLFALSSPLLAASGQSVEQEYQQVRTIALRDRRVQEAYEDADRRLEAKILQIDPALKGYLEHRHRGGAEPVRKPYRMPEPKKQASRPAERPAPTPASTLPTDRTHTVRQGQTLSAIASIYGVTVAGLKKANHIEDERKLRVGQVLAVPPRVN